MAFSPLSGDPVIPMLAEGPSSEPKPPMNPQASSSDGSCGGGPDECRPQAISCEETRKEALLENYERRGAERESLAIQPMHERRDSKIRRDGPLPLQRLADVRKQQGLSLRTVSRRSGMDVKELRKHEDPFCDLPLSLLRKWQQALEVPLADLVEDDQALSRPVMERAKLVRIMKTAVSLRDACQGNLRQTRLVSMLCEQLLDLMPELKDVGSWPQTGARRGPDVMGKIFHEPIALESPDVE